MYIDSLQSPSFVSSDWVAINFTKVIILKDFDVDLIQEASVRQLPKRTISHFDVMTLKNDLYLPAEGTKTVPTAILSILLNSNIRRGGMAKIDPFTPIFLHKIGYFVKNDLPIQLVLPALPHKKQSPITTGHTIDFIDLGDYLCMLQLKNIISSIENVYAPGATITILPDGITLAHLFGRNDLAGAGRYTTKLRQVQNELGLENKIVIKDLQDLFLEENDFNDLKDDIKGLLYTLSKTDPDVAMGMRILQKAMFFNVPFDHSIEDHLRMMKTPFQKLPLSTRSYLEYAAFEYAAILLTMKRLDVVQKAFPHAIRASVHTKATANLPVNLINATSLIFPYNGIPVVRTERLGRNSNIRKATRIMRLYELYKYPSATAVYRAGDEEPFWYEINSLTM